MSALLVHSVCKYGAELNDYLVILKNHYDDGGHNIKKRIVYANLRFATDFDPTELVTIKNVNLSLKLSKRSTAELPADLKATVEKIKTGCKAWEEQPENKDKWKDADFPEMELQNFVEVDDAGELGVAGAISPADVEAAVGDEKDKMIAELLKQNEKLMALMTKPSTSSAAKSATALSPYGSNTELDNFETWKKEVQKWADVNLGKGIKEVELVSAIITALRGDIKKFVLENMDLDTVMSIGPILELLTEKELGTKWEIFFERLSVLFSYKFSDLKNSKAKKAPTAHDHCTRVVKIRSDLESEAFKLPTTFWGWFTLYSLQLEKSQLSVILAQLAGDFSYENVKKIVVSCFADMKLGDDDAVPALNTSTTGGVAQHQSTGDGLKGEIKKEVNEMVQKIMANKKGGGKKGGGSGFPSRGRSPPADVDRSKPCKFGKDCKWNKLGKCWFNHE